MTDHESGATRASRDRTDRRRVDRATLLKGSVVALGAAAGSGAGAARLLAASGDGPSHGRDAEVFAAALALERLQAAFYSEAVGHGHLAGKVRQFAEIVGSQERRHVRYVEARAGRASRERETFHFGSATRDQSRFLATAVMLEDIGVAAYNGLLNDLTPSGLAAASRVASVEARHAAWARALARRSPAPVAIDHASTLAHARDALAHFMGAA